MIIIICRNLSRFLSLLVEKIGRWVGGERDDGVIEVGGDLVYF